MSSLFTENIWPHIENQLSPEACQLGELFFVSPYFTGNHLRTYLKERRVETAILIIQLTPGNVASGAIDADELLEMLNHCKVLSVTNLHSKIAIDKQIAIVGSQNLTAGGEFRNFEGSIISSDKNTVTDIRNVILKLLQNATLVDEALIAEVMSLASELKESVAKIDATNEKFNQRSVRAHSNRELEEASDELRSSFPSDYCLANLSKRMSGPVGFKKSYTTLRKNSNQDDLCQKLDLQATYYYGALDCVTLQMWRVHAGKNQLGMFFKSWDYARLVDDGEFVSQNFLNPLLNKFKANIETCIRKSFDEGDIHLHYFHLFDGQELHYKGKYQWGDTQIFTKPFMAKEAARRIPTTAEVLEFALIDIPYRYENEFVSPAMFFKAEKPVKIGVKDIAWNWTDEDQVTHLDTLPVVLFDQ